MFSRLTLLIHRWQTRRLARHAHRAKRLHRQRAQEAPIAEKLARLDAMRERRKTIRKARMMAH